jgi:flagellar biosynthesis component FlhA
MPPWLLSVFRGQTAFFAVAATIAFVIALVAGLGLEAFAFLGAGIWWLALSRYWTGKERAARRHRELRAKRLEREREGVAPPRG